MKHKKTSERTAIRKVFRLVRRLEPGFFPLLFLTKLIAAVQPFVNIVFGSRIIDKVIEGQDTGRIMQTVFIMVGCNLFLGVVRWALEAALGVKRSSVEERIDQMVSEKSLQLDYELLEKQSTLELVYRAREGMNSHGGIGNFCTRLGDIIDRKSVV